MELPGIIGSKLKGNRKARTLESREAAFALRASADPRRSESSF